MADIVRPKIDLRTKPQPAPAAQPETWLPGPGIPPLKLGVSRRVTDAEAALLSEAGWRPGDPIPGNFAEVRSALLEQQRAEVEHLRPVPPDTPALQVRVQEIETLSPERREYLKRAMAEVQQAAAGVSQAPTEVLSVPGVADALKTATEPAQPKSIDINPTPDNTVVPGTVPTVSAGAPPVETPAAAAVRHCPNCDWDLAQTELVEPTREDRLNFLIALEGPTRFRREYKVADGRYTLVFRQPTTAESHLVFEQLARELEKGDVTEQGAYFARVFNYRLALALDLIETPSARKAMPGLDDLTLDAPPPGAPKPTGLPELYQYLREHVVTSESLFHIVGKAFQDFQRRIDRLEANWNNPDFYRGISGPR